MAAHGTLKAVLWDLDGTILDSRRQHFASSRRAFEEFGLEPLKGNRKEHFGKTAAQIFKETAGDRLNGEDLKRLEIRKDEIYREIVSQDASFLPGVKESLLTFRGMVR